MNESNRKMDYIYRIKYQKTGPLKFISHLDLNTVLLQVLRRSRMPVELTQGFNPRYKVSFAPALSLGVSGWAELAEIHLWEEIPAVLVQESINQNAPAGLIVTDVQLVGENTPSLNRSLSGASYLVDVALIQPQSDEICCGKDERKMIDCLSHKVNEFLNLTELIVPKKTKKGMCSIDLRPMIGGMEIVPMEDDKRIRFRLIVQFGLLGSINPRLILNRFLEGIHEYPLDIYEIIREYFILKPKG